jgi:hypothetical protein
VGSTDEPDGARGAGASTGGPAAVAGAGAAATAAAVEAGTATGATSWGSTVDSDRIRRGPGFFLGRDRVWAPTAPDKRLGLGPGLELGPGTEWGSGDDVGSNAGVWVLAAAAGDGATTGGAASGTAGSVFALLPPRLLAVPGPLDPPMALPSAGPTTGALATGAGAAGCVDGAASTTLASGARSVAGKSPPLVELAKPRPRVGRLRPPLASTPSSAPSPAPSGLAPAGAAATMDPFRFRGTGPFAGPATATLAAALAAVLATDATPAPSATMTLGAASPAPTAALPWRCVTAGP